MQCETYRKPDNGGEETVAEDYTYNVGLSTVDITPPVGIYLSGFAARNERSTGVYHPLRATAVAIDDGTNPLLIVGAEILGFYERAPRVRAAIQEATGLDTAHVILNGSHTHCGPSLREIDGERHGELDQGYIDGLVQKIARCASEAWEGRQPARLLTGLGRCDIAVSRRKPDTRGGVTWAPSPASGHDHEVPVIAVERPDGVLAGVLFSYASHPTSRGGLEIGGDYVGFALDRVEETHSGTVACFMQGCGADQKTRPVDPNATTFVPREVPEIKDIGEDLGDAVSVVLKSGGLRPVSGPISVRQSTLTLESEPVDWDLVEKGLKDGNWLIKEWAEKLQGARDRGEEIVRHFPFEVQTVTFGKSMALVTLAGEITVEHGLRLKRELRPRFDHVMSLGYCNEMMGYVPVKRQIPEGGYEVWFAQQVWRRSGPFVEDTEEKIHSEIQRMLE
jgi:neutral ceramidase